MGATRTVVHRAAPLHPILVHFTIALTSASLLFELLGRALHAPELAATAWWTLVLATTATVATLVTGVVSRAALDIGEGEARAFLRVHMALGPIFFGMLVATTIWRALLRDAGREAGGWYLATLGLTTAVMAVQGYLGGELVYRWGTAVEGRHRGLGQRRAAETPPRPRGATRPAAEPRARESA